MKGFKRFMLLLSALLLAASSALAAKSKSTPTPPPPVVPEEVIEEVPEGIQTVLDLARQELEDTNGKELKKKNKYTKWRNQSEWGWCGGFVTWCMLEAGIPQMEKNKALKLKEEQPGLFHIKEAGQGKLVDGYAHLNRVSHLPQKGFIVIYGNGDGSGKFGGLTRNYHVGLVYDVRRLDNGCYRLTTIEGNVGLNFTDAEGTKHKASHTVRMYIRDYDPNVENLKKNLSLVPEEERKEPESVLLSYDYTYGNKKMYISTFLMPWVPGDPALSAAADAVEVNSP